MAGQLLTAPVILRGAARHGLAVAAALGLAGCAWSSAPAPGFSSSHHKYQQEQSVPLESVPTQAEP